MGKRGRKQHRIEVAESLAAADKPGYELKIERAIQHLDSLDNAIQRWLETDAYTLIDKRKTDPQRTIVSVKPKNEPSPAFGLVIGDCIHNLRSSLDNLVSDLAWRGSAGPVTKRVDRGSAFPIWISPPSQGDIRKRIGTLDPGAQAIIQALQPNDGQHFTPNDVWLLDELWNYDKHRRLHLALFAVVGYGIGRPGENGSISDLHIFGGGPIHRETPLLSYGSVTGNMNMHRAPEFTVTLGKGTPADGQPLIPLLRRLLDHVRMDIVEPLSAFLK